MKNRWLVFIVNSTTSFFISGLMKSNGVILDQMVNYLGSTHSLVSWAFSIQFGLSLMSAPIPKLLLKILSYGQIATTGGFLVGLGYVFCGLCVHSVWQLFLSFILSGIGFGLMDLPCYLALHDNFPGNFGTVFCASSLFHFVGVAVLPPVMQIFNDMFGLRNALLLFGALSWNLVPCGMNLGSLLKSTEETREQNVVERSGHDEEDGSMKNENASETKQTSEDSGMRRKSFLQKYLYFCSSLKKHINFRIAAALEFVVFYIYASWAIFLVSLGTSSGFDIERSVLLSTVGGVGGLVGKLLALLLFHFKKMNAYSCCVIPLVISGISFSASAIVEGFYGLAIFAFVNGATIAHMSSSLVALIPNLVCRQHFQQAATLSCLLDGIACQFGGLLSGLVHDAFGSPHYVFGLNAFLCFISLPFSIMWACGNQEVIECEQV